jgi:hypothetical protein
MLVWTVVFVLAFPFALFGQPVAAQVCLSVVAFLVALTPVVGWLRDNSARITRLVIAPLLVLCLLLGNEQRLALNVAVLTAPLAASGY